jgi:ankyrin repeat protein
MTQRIHSAFFSLLSILALGLMVGCGDAKKVAKSDLGKQGYSFTEKDWFAAAASGDVAALEAFLAGGIDPNLADAAGNTALMKAAAGGQTQFVEKLLGAGADPRMQNLQQRDALLSAAAKGHAEVARLLVARGADATLQDVEGWRALSIGSYHGHQEVVSLLAGQASAELLDDALLVASFTPQRKVVEILLGHGANINARSPEDRTPLMIAAEAGEAEVVQSLLQNQANPYATDPQNRNAAALATLAGHPKVADLINTPANWGNSEIGKQIVLEREEARKALAQQGVSEDLGKAPELALTPKVAPAPKLKSEFEAGNEVAEQFNGLPESASDPIKRGKEKFASAATGRETPLAGSLSIPVGGEPVLNASQTATLRPQANPTANPVAHSAAAQAPRTPGNPSMTPVLARQVRADAQDKPMVPLRGSKLKSTQPQEAPVQWMVLAGYHEEPLPLAVAQVKGKEARVRVLDQGNAAPVLVTKGSEIPGTSYQVTEVDQRYISSKEGKGKLVDASRVTVKDSRTGASHLLVLNVEGQAADTYAIIASPQSQYRYVVKTGDVFQTEQPGVGVVDYEVLDIRAEGVVVKDRRTENVTVIARDGVQ